MPLGMSRTHYTHADYLSEPDRAHPHVLTEAGWIEQENRNPDAEAPAGGAAATVRDLAKWMSLLLNKGAFAGRTIISPQVLEDMWTPQLVPAAPVGKDAAPYGLGWQISDGPYGRHVSHSGVFTSDVRALIDLMPEEGTGIAIVANGFPSAVPEGLAAAYWRLAFEGRLAGDPIVEANQQYVSGYEKFLASRSLPTRSNPETDILPESVVGHYFDPYFGDIEIEYLNGSLTMAMGPAGRRRFTPKPYDVSVFTFAPFQEAPDLGVEVKFEIGDDGRATSLMLVGLGPAIPRRAHRIP
jgi:CubicO group peptidase (beta-lactamase class C family)